MLAKSCTERMVESLKYLTILFTGICLSLHLFGLCSTFLRGGKAQRDWTMRSWVMLKRGTGSVDSERAQSGRETCHPRMFEQLMVTFLIYLASTLFTKGWLPGSRDAESSH